MKIRPGFVSNSSSSSFVMMVSKGTSIKEIRSKVEKHIGKMEGFFLPNFRQDLINTIMECKGSLMDLEGDLQYEIDWISKNPGSCTLERDRFQELIDKNMDIYDGGFSDNGEGALQLFLCNTNFKIEEEDFFMENMGGY